MPGVDFITINERTANDVSVTPSITYKHNNYNFVLVHRNLFFVTDINEHSPSVAWNAISISSTTKMTAQAPVRRYKYRSWLSVSNMITVVSIFLSTRPLQIYRIRSCLSYRNKHSAFHVNVSISLGRSSSFMLQGRLAK